MGCMQGLQRIGAARGAQELLANQLGAARLPQHTCQHLQCMRTR